MLRIFLEICRRENPGLAEITVNSSPYAVPVYQRLGFGFTGAEETKNGIRYVPMKMDMRGTGSIEKSCYQKDIGKL